MPSCKQHVGLQDRTQSKGRVDLSIQMRPGALTGRRGGYSRLVIGALTGKRGGVKCCQTLFNDNLNVVYFCQLCSHNNPGIHILCIKKTEREHK